MDLTIISAVAMSSPSPASPSQSHRERDQCSSQDSDVTVAVDSSSPSILSKDILPVVDSDESLSVMCISPVAPVSLPSQQQLSTDSVSSLTSIQTEQDCVEKELQVFLQQSSTIFSLSSDSDLRKKLTVIEVQLKDISHRNQKEREDIANHIKRYGPSEDVKAKLLDLAQRHKTLLPCFKKHNELMKNINSIKANCTPTVATETRPIPLTNSIGNDPVQLKKNDNLHETGLVPIPDSETRLRLISDSETRLRPIPDSETRLKPQPDNETRLRPIPDSETRLRLIPDSQTSLTAEHTKVTDSSEVVNLSQPVPLDVLIKHDLLIIGEKLSCTLLGCHFEATLTRDGQLIDCEKNKTYCSPQVWLSNCWSALGHQKRLNKRQVYKTLMYKNSPLLSVCEKYSRKQVSNYQQKKLQNELTTLHEKPLQTQYQQQVRNDISIVPQAHCTLKNTQKDHLSTEFDLDTFLNNCRILPLPSTPTSSLLTLPDNFWGTWSFETLSQTQYNQLDVDLQWPITSNSQPLL